MTETTTTSVEGDRLEAIARIVASSSVDSRAVRSDEVWAAIKPSSREECFDYARQIAALPCKGGEDERPTREALERRAIEAVEAYADWADLNADMFDSCDAPNAAADAMMKRAYAALEAVKAVATPSTEPDTGRGLREVVTRAVVESAHLSHEALHRTVDAVLAALSDTPRGREEEGKQDLMASRDLGPPTVASSLKGSDVGGVKP